MNEERKDENEVLGKIELITGARYRPVGLCGGSDAKRPDSNVEELELLIKWSNQSYFHLDWIFKSDFEILGQGVGAGAGSDA